MLRWLLSIALVTTALVGCLGSDEVVEETAAPVEVPDVPGVVSHTAGGEVPVPERFRDLDVRAAYTGFSGPEPTVGVTSDGTIFTTAGGASVARSTDGGQSWELVAEPTSGPFTPKASLDPWLWVDTRTDRVFNAPLYVACTWLSWSDDGGDSWLAAPHGGCGLPAHDHQKLTTGPPPDGVETLGYESVLYYSYNSFRGEGMWVSTSLDGGLTWSVGQAVHPADCIVGAAGGVHVGPEGTAYTAKPTCQGVNIAVSHDAGESWEHTTSIDQAGIQSQGETRITNPDLDTDPAGNVYLAYTGGDGLLYFSKSTDQGITWTPPVAVTPPNVNVTAFSVIAVGEAGKAAFGYLGTTADPSDWDMPDAHSAPDETVWHAYLTLTDDALAAEPTFTTAQVTPDDDPAQRGCIWLEGGGNPCRNLLDFIDMVEHEGRPYLAFADGCDQCESAEESRDRAGAVAIVETGPSLTEGVLEPLVEG